jgi:hypothetical protein
MRFKFWLRPLNRIRDQRGGRLCARSNRAVAPGTVDGQVTVCPRLDFDLVPIPSVVPVDRAGEESLAIEERLRGFERCESGGDTLLTDDKERVTREHQPSIDQTSKHPDAVEALHVLSMMDRPVSWAADGGADCRSSWKAGAHSHSRRGLLFLRIPDFAWESKSAASRMKAIVLGGDGHEVLAGAMAT